MTSVPGGEAYVMRTMGDDGEYEYSTYAMRMGDALWTPMATTTTSVAGYIYVTSLASSSEAYVMRTVGSAGVYGTTTYAMAAHGTVTMMN